MQFSVWKKLVMYDLNGESKQTHGVASVSQAFLFSRQTRMCRKRGKEGSGRTLPPTHLDPAALVPASLGPVFSR